MARARPVIGIAAALEIASYGVWEKPCALIQLLYVEALQRADGLALVIPPDPRLLDDPDEILDRIDGLMLAGGPDVDPAAYGASRDPQTGKPVPERDRFEFALVRRAIERDLPVLGICRGMQVLNVACGGTLVQHLPDRVGHGQHRRRLGTFEGNEHDVELVPGSLAAAAAGEQRTLTHSHHHQAIDALGEGLIVTGRATIDGLPEAIEAPDRSYVLGVQWHPEVNVASQVIGSLVEAAARQPDVGASALGSDPGAPVGASR